MPAGLHWPTMGSANSTGCNYIFSNGTSNTDVNRASKKFPVVVVLKKNNVTFYGVQVYFICFLYTTIFTTTRILTKAGSSTTGLKIKWSLYKIYNIHYNHPFCLFYLIMFWFQDVDSGLGCTVHWNILYEWALDIPYGHVCASKYLCSPWNNIQDKYYIHTK